MKKIVFLDSHARHELKELPEIIQEEFSAQFKTLEEEGKLDYPSAKKLDSKLFEIRIKINNTYRGFYAYIESQYIIILHIFQKKSQKTPLQNLKTARKRLTEYD